MRSFLNVKYLLLFAIVFAFTCSCSMFKQKSGGGVTTHKDKNFLGHYNAAPILDSTFLIYSDSTTSTIRLPSRSRLSIVLNKKHIVYCELASLGPYTPTSNTDGIIPKQYRRGKWEINSDTLFLTFSDANKSSNSSYVIHGDSLIPLIAQEKTIFIRMEDD